MVDVGEISELIDFSGSDCNDGEAAAGASSSSSELFGSLGPWGLKGKARFMNTEWAGLAKPWTTVAQNMKITNVLILSILEKCVT